MINKILKHLGIIARGSEDGTTGAKSGLVVYLFPDQLSVVNRNIQVKRIN
jgi:hypothetical protein